MRILIVDDQKSVRSMIRRMMSGIDARIDEAADGQEAVLQYAAIHPDIVLMDIRMPVMNGIEATRHIRSADPTARILVVTDYDDIDLRESAAQAGVERYFLKEDLSSLRRFLQSNPSMN